MTRKRKRRQKVVAFSRCSCAQRVAGRLAGIELDGSSPGNRIFSLSLLHVTPLPLRSFSLCFSLSLYASVLPSPSSVPYRCSSRVRPNLLSPRPTFLSPPHFLYIVMLNSLFLSLSLSFPVKSRRSSSNTPHRTYTRYYYSLILSRSPDSPPPCIFRNAQKILSLVYTLAEDFRQTAHRSPPPSLENNDTTIGDWILQSLFFLRLHSSSGLKRRRSWKIIQTRLFHIARED